MVASMQNYQTQKPRKAQNPILSTNRIGMLYSWFSDRDYALGLSRVNTLISPIAIPPELRTFVEEARQCYALSQSNAVYSLSRTILEAAVNDLCVRTRRMPKYIVDEALFDDERYSFRNRLKLLADGPRVS